VLGCTEKLASLCAPFPRTTRRHSRMPACAPRACDDVASGAVA
jgi:hypothetical protein